MIVYDVMHEWWCSEVLRVAGCGCGRQCVCVEGEHNAYVHTYADMYVRILVCTNS